MDGQLELLAGSRVEDPPVPGAELEHSLKRTRQRFRNNLMEVFGKPLDFE